ncbi:DUF1566 domain-containing protein [Portibacter marinus]|uniref:DUF1566 domain-containing protein n=1 Tax=Portibacter marinus TaxID=2898660 RepID=UPI001F2EF94B|nr:DUF1566 domain-containing protein [Portibacter marinus]
MKNLICLFLAVFIIVGCEKESISDLHAELEIYETHSLMSPTNKREVCHKGEIISIDLTSIPDHQAHGDAIDMDGDGFFNIDNPCSEIDCDDTLYNPENLCSCVEGELEVHVDPDGIPNSSDEYTLYVSPSDNGLVTYNATQWPECVDILDLPNISDQAAALADFDGINNTSLIVDQIGDEIYAANTCVKLSVETGCDWYLPALGELEAMYQQLSGDAANNFTDSYYWSSTEASECSAWWIIYGDHTIGNDGKFNGAFVRCVHR